MARLNPRYEELIKESKELASISIQATQSIRNLTPQDIVSDKATALRETVSEANKELTEVNKEIVIASDVNKIIEDIDSGRLIIPDWFNNNITWVLTEHITNQSFLTTYHYLLNRGEIHAPIIEPIIEPIITAPPLIQEQKNTYWLIKPDNRFGQKIEVTQS